MEILGKSLLLIIADILSFITIVLCLISKVPQIKTLVDIKSAKGNFLTIHNILLLPNNLNIHIIILLYTNVA